MPNLDLEYELESIRRLAHAVWLIGQHLMEDDADNVGPAVKQIAEEIEDKLARLLRPQVAA
jgi:hypothetical protein